MELITVIAILTIITAIVVPSCAGFTERAKVQRYVLEADGVRRSVELYLLEHYQEEEFDSMMLMIELGRKPLDSPEHMLHGRLLTVCTPGAVIEHVTLGEDNTTVLNLVYCVNGYRIELDGGRSSVEKMRSRPSDR